jgi:hypothetical protein
MLCQTISLLPSPLKSAPVEYSNPCRRQQHSTSAEVEPVHEPDRAASIGMLPEDVALAVTVKVAALTDAPAVPGPSNPAPPVILDPFINQAASLPSVCCQRMSLLPSPLKVAAQRSDSKLQQFESRNTIAIGGHCDAAVGAIRIAAPACEKRTRAALRIARRSGRK